MHLTQDTHGTAYIEVNSTGTPAAQGPQTTSATAPEIHVTRRVKTFAGGVLGLVIWRVRNVTGVEGSVTVAIEPIDVTHELFAFDHPVVFLGNSSIDVDEGKTGAIVGFAQGSPGDKINYVVTINGTPAGDPHIEI